MLTNFEAQEAKSLRESISKSFFDFVLNPSIATDIDRLEYLEKQCEHHFVNGICEYCGKDE